MSDPIRVFIATSPDGLDAEANMACEWSIRSRTSRPVEITFMALTRDDVSPWFCNPAKGSGWQTRNWVTTFSGLRWAIPSACKWQGRAIYTDNDVIFLADIAELFDMPLAPGKVAAAKSEKRFCVTLFDCAACKPYISDYKSLQNGGGRTIKGRADLVQVFTAEQSWNCLDGENLAVDEIKGLHFTSIDSQPAVPLAVSRLEAQGQRHWFDGKPRAHWRPELTEAWQAEFDAALAAGYKIEDYIPAEVFGPVPKRNLSGYRGLHPS